MTMTPADPGSQPPPAFAPPAASPTPPGPGSTVPPAPPSRPATRRLLSASAALILLVVGVLVIGIGIGWIAHARIGSSSNAAPVTGDIVVPSLPPAQAAQTSDNLVPDLRGLTQPEAQQVLADAGLPIDGIKVVQQPYVGESDVVIAQEPIGGAAYDGSITIVLPVPATMPDLAGKSETDARQALPTSARSPRWTASTCRGPPRDRSSPPIRRRARRSARRRQSSSRSRPRRATWWTSTRRAVAAPAPPSP